MACLGAGLRFYELQRYAGAANELRRALQIDPSLVDARYHLAVCYFEEKQFDHARQQFERLATTGYRSRWVTYYLGRLALQSGRLAVAIGRFESLRGPQPLHDELYYLGAALLRKGDTQKAQMFLRREIAYNPLDFRAHYLLGQAYLKLGRKQTAEAQFQESEKIHRYYLRGKEDLVACREQLQAGHNDSAWSRCGSVLQSNDVDKLVAVGTLFGEFHDYGHALKALHRAVELDPESPEANYDLGYTYYQTTSYSQAYQYSQAAIAKRPDFFEALEVCGMALHQLARDKDARPALARAHQLRPDDMTVTEMLKQVTRPPAR